MDAAAACDSHLLQQLGASTQGQLWGQQEGQLWGTYEGDNFPPPKVKEEQPDAPEASAEGPEPLEVEEEEEPSRQPDSFPPLAGVPQDPIAPEPVSAIARQVRFPEPPRAPR